MPWRYRSYCSGDVLTGRAEGRTVNDDITIFDSSGLSVQDLYIAKALLELWDLHKADS